MNVDYWIAFLRHDLDALKSFQKYLEFLISESSKQFKTAKSMEEVSKIQGRIEALEQVHRDFNREQLQEMEHVLFTNRTRSPSS